MKKPDLDIKYYLSIALLVALAFAGGYATSVNIGAFASCMLLVPAAAACGFLKMRFWLKAAAFALFGYFLNSFYGGDTARSIACALLCGACAAACHLGAALIRGKKPLRLSAGIALVLVTALPCLYVLGSPFAAFKSEKLLAEYTRNTYGGSGYTAGGLSYDSGTGRFYVSVTPDTDRSQSFVIAYDGNGIIDGYRSYALLSQFTKARSLLVSALRDAFPDDKFEVVSEKAVNVSAGKVEPENMVFAVYISAYVSDAEFTSRAVRYTEAARNAGAGFAYLVFYGGRAGSYYRTLTLRGDSVFEKAVTRYVSPVKTERFFLELFGARLPDSAGR